MRGWIHCHGVRILAGVRMADDGEARVKRAAMKVIAESITQTIGNPSDQAKRLRDLEAENARLKKAVAELTVDKIILKEVAEGKF